jgi:4'-phosphopantetheinyl transferase EntD
VLGFRHIMPSVFSLEEGWVNDLASELHPAERALVVTAVASRRREFAAGRTCARRALHPFGMSDWPVLVGRAGSPIWPRGIVGSISHTSHYCGAVAAYASQIAAVGIDVEVAVPFDNELLQMVCTRDEILWCERHENVCHSLLFSAKESALKAFFALLGSAPALREMNLTLDLTTGRFSGSSACRRDSALEQLFTNAEGRFYKAGGYVFTAMWITSDHRPT